MLSKNKLYKFRIIVPRTEKKLARVYYIVIQVVWYIWLELCVILETKVVGEQQRGRNEETKVT